MAGERCAFEEVDAVRATPTLRGAESRCVELICKELESFFAWIASTCFCGGGDSSTLGTKTTLPDNSSEIIAALKTTGVLQQCFNEDEERKMKWCAAENGVVVNSIASAGRLIPDVTAKRQERITRGFISSQPVHYLQDQATIPAPLVGIDINPFACTELAVELRPRKPCGFTERMVSEVEVMVIFEIWRRRFIMVLGAPAVPRKACSELSSTRHPHGCTSISSRASGAVLRHCGLKGTSITSSKHQMFVPATIFIINQYYSYCRRILE